MKKRILLAAALITSFLISAQPFQFKLNWKVGDKRLVTGNTHEKEYENGKLIKDTVEYHESEITVLKDLEKYYTINIRQENVALKSVVQFFDKVHQSELAKYKDLNLKYRIDKKTGAATLENWKATRDQVLKSYGDVETYLKNKMPGQESIAKMIFAPLKLHFKTQKDMEAFFSSQVNYLEYPFDQKISLNDTLTLTGKEANPFNPGDSVSSSFKYVVKNLNKTTQQFEVWQRMDIDLESFKKFMKDMMKGMMKSFAVADSTVQKNTKQFDKLDMDMDVQRLITYNYETSWPVKIEINAKQIFEMSGKRTESYSTIQASLK